MADWRFREQLGSLPILNKKVADKPGDVGGGIEFLSEGQGATPSSFDRDDRVIRPR